jgi:hypothetical protein
VAPLGTGLGPGSRPRSVRTRAPSEHHQGTIGAPSEHHRSAIRAPSERHQSTNRAPSEHHQITPPEHHQRTNRAPSEHPITAPPEHHQSTISGTGFFWGVGYSSGVCKRRRTSGFCFCSCFFCVCFKPAPHLKRDPPQARTHARDVRVDRELPPPERQQHHARGALGPEAGDAHQVLGHLLSGFRCFNIY